jgi:hypothetical protein
VVPNPAPDGFGSEPGILAARDGTVYVVSVLGSATARGDALWASRDGGVAWEYLGKPDYPFGGGDADIDEDARGTLYLPGQWRPAAPPPESPLQPYITGGESVAVSKDKGRTWTVFPVASNLPVTDRQWVATYGDGTAWLAFNQAQSGLVVTKTTNGGATWTPSKVVDGTWTPGDGVLLTGGPNGIPGDLLVDPRDGTLYIPYAPELGSQGGFHRLFVSKDGGSTFRRFIIHATAPGEQPSAIFGTLAMDAAGGLHYAWAQTVEGQKYTRVLLRNSPDGGGSWGPAIPVSPEGMSAVFPWIVAGQPGHVAVAFYGASGRFLSDDAPAEQPWYPILATSRNVADGNGTFEMTPLSPVPNHKGPICTGGTGCTGGRTLGDFFEIGLDRDGRVVAVWADDTGTARVNVVGRMATGSLL